MSKNSDTLEVLKLKLKSATKLRFNMERELCQARNRERFLSEQLETEKAEIEFIVEQLEDVKSQISLGRHQISMVAICSTSERSKISAHIAKLEHHKEEFQSLFDKERNLFDIRMKEIQEKEAEEQEVLRQKESELAKSNEQQASEAAAVEAECEMLERECTVLKKRNNAIMLQLRRKLLETENIRREFAKRNTI